MSIAEALKEGMQTVAAALLNLDSSNVTNVEDTGDVIRVTVEVKKENLIDFITERIA